MSAAQCPGIHCPCTPGHEKGATMIDVGMVRNLDRNLGKSGHIWAYLGHTLRYLGQGYVGAKTNPGRDTNIVFDGLHGIGPTGALLNAHGLDNASGCPG